MKGTRAIKTELYDRTWMLKARTLLGLTQLEVAHESGISQGNYNQIEQGLRTPNVRVGLMITRVLGVASDIWLTEKRIA